MANQKEVVRHRDIQLNVRLTEAGKELFDRLREYYGLSGPALIEMLTRDKAREVGVIVPGSGEEASLRKLRDSLQSYLKPSAGKKGAKNA